MNLLDYKKSINESNRILDNIRKSLNSNSFVVEESKKINVACILDEFSYNSFKDEANLIYLSRNNWKKEVENVDIDFLFVESAWMGLHGDWRYKFINLHENSEFKKTSYNQIIELLNYFKEKYIPTVFWNKEDPIHFDEFIYLAKEFDYIFTTDSNSIERYKNECGHTNVFALQFAANLKMHNPINKDKNKIGKLAFAGSWYERHEERKKVTREILDRFSNEDLTIYDRHYGKDTNGRNDFPIKYQKYIKCGLPYNEMVKAYKYYDIFLNVNTVLESPTMYSRRVYELLACGSNVITTRSLGIRMDFGSLIPMISEPEDEIIIKKMVESNEYRDRNSVKCIREIVEKHTYEKRFYKILDIMKLNYEKKQGNKVSVITCTNRGEYLENIINNYLQQTFKDKELIVIINKDSINLNEVKDRVKDLKNVYIYKLAENKTLGECINYAVQKSKNEYIAKFDDDDYYAPNYLMDMMNVFKFSDAEVVGKKSMYIYYEALKKLAIKYPENEHKYTDFVAGATLVFKREVFNKIQLESRNQGEDTSFLENCKALGIKIYTSDKYNFIALRRADKNSHTWQIDDESLSKKSKFIDEKFNSFDDAKKYVTV